jgi:hypothetical protein
MRRAGLNDGIGIGVVGMGVIAKKISDWSRLQTRGRR